MFEKILARYAIISNIYSCTRANYIYEEEYEKSFFELSPANQKACWYSGRSQYLDITREKVCGFENMYMKKKMRVSRVSSA